MTRALIGHTGFVGSNLRTGGNFTHFYNSANFRDMAGQSFGEVVCAGVSAVKWLANKEPEQDWAGIKALLDVLSEVRAERFTLISTIDVYPDPSRPDDENTLLSPDEGQPYGRHRLAIERFVRERFSDVLVARLPALFGPGLKKNALFDLLNDNQTGNINPAASFQWYPVERLSSDLETARGARLELVNLFPAPVVNARIVDELFPAATVGEAKVPAPRYALRTHHAKTFGGADGHIMDADAVFAAIARFVESARGAKEQGGGAR